MRYSTYEYLRDSYGFMDTFFSFWNKLKPKIKKIIIRAIDFEYDFYIERVFENLIPAFFIVYLGIIAVFTLTKYSEKASGVRISSITTNSMSPGIDPGSIDRKSTRLNSNH